MIAATLPKIEGPTVTSIPLAADPTCTIIYRRARVLGSGGFKAGCR